MRHGAVGKWILTPSTTSPSILTAPSDTLRLPLNHLRKPVLTSSFSHEHFSLRI